LWLLLHCISLSSRVLLFLPTLHSLVVAFALCQFRQLLPPQVIMRVEEAHNPMDAWHGKEMHDDACG
jgi:hypothetical protein